MVTEVTLPVEQAVRAVPGVRDCAPPRAEVARRYPSTFDWSQDMVAAMLQVQSAINQVLASSAAGHHLQLFAAWIRRCFPCIAYSLTSDTHSLVELRDIAFYQLRPCFRPSAA